MLRAYQDGLSYYLTMELQFQLALTERVGPLLAPAMLVYIFQVQIKGWYEEQWMHPGYAELPNINGLFSRYKQERNLEWLPDISNVPSLLRLRDAIPGKAAAPAVGAPGRGVIPRANNNVGGVQVPNPTWGVRYKENNEFCKNIKTWKVSKAVAIMQEKGKSPPLKIDGTQAMCII